jgi:hypothetical protein
MASLGDDPSASETSTGTGQKRRASSTLQLGPRKKLFIILVNVLDDAKKLILLVRTTQDPLVHHGRHFGRAVHAFCNLQSLLMNGLITMGSDATDLESLTAM